MFNLADLFSATAANIERIAAGPYPDSVARAIDVIYDALAHDRKLLICGNGGSAADSQHIAAELVGRFAIERRALPAIALTANQSILTAWSNDHAFEDVFARQVEALGRTGDVAWGISTSGNSRNVINALRRARELGLKTIGLTGKTAPKMEEHCDVLMAVPLTETPRIQEVHVVTYHAICAALEHRLFGAGR